MARIDIRFGRAEGIAMGAVARLQALALASAELEVMAATADAANQPCAVLAA